MGHNENRRSSEIHEETKVKEINKELSKFSLSFQDLPKKTQQYLLKAEDFFIDQLDDMRRALDNLKDIDFTVDSFCKYAGIARSTIYKKNSNGLKAYDAVIYFINSKSSSADQTRLSMLRDYIRTGTTDQKLMTSLLEKEVERMNLKQELEDKNEQIKSLEAQLKAYKKSAENSRKMS